MPKKKENLIEKIVKKDYNNELETILEEKDFAENAKSILLSILYKIEAAYKDVETVKQNVENKEEYIKNYIEIIKYNCNKLKIVNMRSEETQKMQGKTFLIDKEKKEIYCFQIERKVLYAISKISKKDKIINEKYQIIDETISDLINVGSCINMVEPLRDFNGYSWTSIPKEIESIKHNLIYQDLRILLGYQFLNKWITNSEYMLDYFEKFKILLEENYGEKISKNIVALLAKISVLLDVRFDQEKKQRFIKQKKEIKAQIELMENKEEFIQNVTNEKMKITKLIREKDTIINNKKMLEQEYIKRNENLPLEKKIFSIRVLTDIMIREREKLFEQIEALNKTLNPQNFVEIKQELEEKSKYLEYVDLSEKEVEQKIDEEVIEFQKLFLEVIEKQIKKIENKSQIIKLIYQFRYYNLLPFNENTKIGELNEIKKEREKIIKELLNKAKILKAINSYSKNAKINYEIEKNVFYSRIIKLEDLQIKITKEKENYYIQLFDEKMFEEKIKLPIDTNIPKKSLDIKVNRKIKLIE